MIRKIRFTGEEVLLLKKVQEVIGFSYNKADHFLKDNHESKNLPDFTAKTRIFNDLIDSVTQYKAEVEDTEDIKQETALLQRLEAVVA